MAEYTYKDLFNSDTVSSNSEMQMIVAVARLLERRGHTLTIEGVTADLTVLKGEAKEFFEYAVQEGVLLTNWEPERTYLRPGYLWFDLGWLDRWDEVIPMNESKGYREWNFESMVHSFWTTEWRDRVLGRNSASTFLYVYAEQFCRNVIDGIEEKAVFKFSDNLSKNPSNYIVALSAEKMNPQIGEFSKLEITLADTLLDYLVYMYSSQDQGHNQKYTIDEKVAIAEHLGLTKGRVCVKWTRDQIRQGESAGRIKSRSLVILEGIEGEKIKYTVVPEPMTLEEKAMEYDDVPDEHKHIYGDLLEKTIKTHRRSSDLFNVAFGNYISDETEIFLPLARGETVEKYITSLDDDGNPQLYVFNMSAEDAIYWFLKQYGVPFDEGRYKKDNYPEGVEPAYEMYSYEVLRTRN